MSKNCPERLVLSPRFIDLLAPTAMSRPPEATLKMAFGRASPLHPPFNRWPSLPSVWPSPEPGTLRKNP
ncbi:conserved hypothetical protein [Ricinus communis]|uniref:Uncharacterized protein n=1 Tax=Ricinus communis TaxID=3988 RepID=B9TFG6_RICCO|nr:conserved hypothetical protein [Ricinus communis]